MRRTYKEPKVYGGYESVECDDFACVSKLGPLEDAEDKLGIDLVTVSKAIEGIKNKSVYNIEEKCEVFVNSIIYYGDDLIIKGYSNNSVFLVKEYGKTWVLTKEELE